MLSIFGILVFVGLFLFYYVIPLTVVDFSQIFITSSSFLFAIFAGFFISRQGKRYNNIRETIADFDGQMSSLYRSFEHLSKDARNKAHIIIRNHYETILKKKKWDYHFTNKSSTISSLHELAQSSATNKPLASLKHLAIQRVLVSLQALQVLRKRMVTYSVERVPYFQWILIYFIMGILFVTISTAISSYQEIYASLLKSAFITVIILTVVLLHQLDRLHFFESIVGENSARDILDILEGKK